MKATKKFNTGVIRFTFTVEDGDVFSSFRMNPTDVNLIKRAEEVSEYFANKKVEGGFATAAELQAYNKEIEDKINYLLGYDAGSEIFGQITATTISPDGDIFAFVVLDYIIEKLQPEIQKRKQAMQNAADRYTRKYKS